MPEQKSYQEQLNKFYNKQLKSYEVINIGKTPEFLVKLGARQLPVVMKQSTLSKCVREARGSRSAHALTRESIDLIPQILYSPAVLINSSKISGKFALISNEFNEQGEPLLLAMELQAKVQDKEVNQITSFYGREHCREYFERQNDAVIIDMKKAKILSRLLGLQLPTTWKNLDYIDTLSQYQKNVKENIFDIERDICRSGYQPSKILVESIQRLCKIKDKNISIKEICEVYRQGCINAGEEEKLLIQNIARECQYQELQQLTDTPEL